jgi:hypothetical protein
MHNLLSSLPIPIEDLAHLLSLYFQLKIDGTCKIQNLHIFKEWCLFLSFVVSTIKQPLPKFQHLSLSAQMSQPHFGLSVRMKLIPKSGNLESSGTLKNSELDFRCQNTFHLGVIYINGKVSKCRCPKWPCMSHLDICSPSYGQKKGRESNWKFDSRPLKVENRRESTSSRRLQKECNRALESSRRDLWLWFRPHSNRRSKLGNMNSQSPGSPTQDNFGTPPWESREKVSFGCGSRGVTQRILYGGRWWLPPSPGRGESSESKVARGLSQHQKGA